MASDNTATTGCTCHTGPWWGVEPPPLCWWCRNQSTFGHYRYTLDPLPFSAPARLSDEDVERIAEALAKKLKEAK